MITTAIRISKDMNGTFWVEKGGTSTAAFTYDAAKVMAEKLFNEAGGDGYAVVEDRIAHPTERTIRRRALNAGYRVRKSRKVNTTYDNQGEYMLIDVDTGFPAYGYRYDASLDDIAVFLAGDDGEAA